MNPDLITIAMIAFVAGFAVGQMIGFWHRGRFTRPTKKDLRDWSEALRRATGKRTIADNPKPELIV